MHACGNADEFHEHCYLKQSKDTGCEISLTGISEASTRTAVASGEWVSSEGGVFSVGRDRGALEPWW